MNDNLLDTVYDIILSREMRWIVNDNTEITTVPTREQVSELLTELIDSIEEGQSVMQGGILVQKINGFTEVYVYAGDLEVK